MNRLSAFRNWPWLTLQIVAANVVVISALAMAWYFTFMRQSSVYSERLMSTFNIEPGRLHAMYVDDVERQLWISVVLGLIIATLVSIGLALLIVRPLRSLAKTTEQLRLGDYRARSHIVKGEVGRLAKNFNTLAATLEQEESRRSQFMVDLGHELRTPIMSLQGYTEGLEDKVFKPDKDYFKLIAGELKQLTMLTHTIENLQLNSETIEYCSDEQALTIQEHLDGAKHRWQARFENRRLNLELDIPSNFANGYFDVSTQSLKQIFDNLLSNMIRYAAADEPCRIEVLPCKEQNLLTLVFSNQTTDISENTIPFLFDRFYRASQSRTRVLNEHPTGLGLSVVKQLCIANKGNVRASLNGSRLAITLYLPLSLQRTTNG